MPSSLQCPICQIDFDAANHLPKINPTCGHTICKKCLFDILEESYPKCSIDNKPFADHLRDIGEFPTNFVLQDLIEEKKQEEGGINRCAEHSKAIEYFCYDCEKGICVDCFIIDGAHKRHKITGLTQVKVQLESAKKEAQKNLEIVDELQNQLNESVNANRITTINGVEKQIDDVINALQDKKAHLINSFGNFFNKEQVTIEELFGPDSDLRTKLTKIISLGNGNDKILDIDNVLQALRDLNDTTIVLSQMPGRIDYYKNSLGQLPKEFEPGFRGYLHYVQIPTYVNVHSRQLKNLLPVDNHNGKAQFVVQKKWSKTIVKFLYLFVVIPILFEICHKFSSLR